MSRRQRAVLALLALLAAFVVWLATRSRQAPLIPSDDTHARWESADACLTCHGPDGTVPRAPKHPLGFDCLRCHGQR